jgi:uncharacterized protein (TIGR03067 family)
MDRLAAAVCAAIVVIGALPALAQRPGDGAPLQGTWIVVRAIRDGNVVDDVVGFQLSLMNGSFRIQSKDGKRLNAGTVRLDPSRTPAEIDLAHTEGDLRGKIWRGIYAVSGETLTLCDNAPNLDLPRPTSFEPRRGYSLLTFRRAKP